MRRAGPARALCVLALLGACSSSKGAGSDDGGEVFVAASGPASATTSPSVDTSEPAGTVATTAAASPASWDEIAATLEPEFDAASANVCGRGEVPGCLDAILEELEQRQAELGCQHGGLFATAYLEETLELRNLASAPGTFEDPEFMVHLAAVFVQQYFDAQDAWADGRHDGVPRAWAIAFAAWDDETTTTLGDVLLGMNAHISRDLVYALAVTGADDPTRQSDYDRVNDSIEAQTPGVLAALQARFDPSITTLNPPLAVGAASFPALVRLWRADTLVWARQMSAATTPADRADVERTVELVSGQRGDLLRTITATLPVVGDLSGRDEYCATQVQGN